jgi:hypothetical protein
MNDDSQIDRGLQLSDFDGDAFLHVFSAKPFGKSFGNAPRHSSDALRLESSQSGDSGYDVIGNADHSRLVFSGHCSHSSYTDISIVPFWKGGSQPDKQKRFFFATGNFSIIVE